MQRGRQVRNIQTLPILAIEVDCKRKKSDPRRCARHNGRVRENPGRQQACWGFLIRCTNLTQPTGNLDSNSSEVVMRTLESINGEMGKTILLVTHDPMIASFCKRIIFLKDGQVIENLKRADNKEMFYQEILKRMKNL